ncbi:alpha/beta hydrolase [Erysipelothrix sp. D19-032]
MVISILTRMYLATVVRRAFDVGIAKPPENYDEIRAQVDVQENLVYPSVETDNIFDLYKPKNATGMEPVIIWVHGGAFVGGDKADITEYSVLLAQRGFVVANMNYQRAPKQTTPVKLYKLESFTRTYHPIAICTTLNMDKVFYAGDSAGAHIVSQFVLIQNDLAYSEKVGIKPVMAPNTIARSRIIQWSV